MTEGPVECPLVMIKLEKLRVVFTTDINYDVTFRELFWIPGPDNFGIFKPAISQVSKYLFINNIQLPRNHFEHGAGQGLISVKCSIVSSNLDISACEISS